MKSNPTRFWWSVIALGWAFDFLFWKKTPGINFAIYVVLCLAAGYLILRTDGQHPASRTLWLLAPMTVLLALTVIRQEPLTTFLSYATTLFLMIIFTLTYLGGRWLQYSLFDYILGFFRLLGSMVARPLGFAAEVKRSASSDGEQAEGPKRSATRIWPILRGILIALPIVAIFAALLSSADLIFQQRLNDFIELFNLENLPEYIFRLVYILVGAYALVGVYLHAATQSHDEKLVGEEKPVVPAFLGFTESTIVLGSVVLLFAIFVAIQFQYFFGGQANIHIEGYTYSEYARRGFGELVAVAFFSLLLLLGLSSITRRENEGQRRVFSGFGITLVLLVIVMLVSAYRRLVLYETAYGFSRLRTYTHVFMIWLGLLLVAVVALEILHRERTFALAAVLASLGFVISLGVLNVDGFIVKQNIARGVVGEQLDIQYLTQLSNDAIPTMAQAYQTPSLPATVKDGVGAALTCYTANRPVSSKPLPWQSFHFSRWNADRALNSLEADLGDYSVDDSSYYPIVTSPMGKDYDCGYSWID